MSDFPLYNLPSNIEDYERRRDHLVKMMRFQKDTDEDIFKKPKGRKPSPSKRIVNVDKNKPKKFGYPK